MSSLLDPAIAWATELEDGDIVYLVRPGAPVGQRARRMVGADLKASAGLPAYGVTGDRPAPAAEAVGLLYFDTTLGQPVWWSGSGWVDATGVAA